MLAILAAISSLVISIRLWTWVSAFQEILPLPGLYLLEMVWFPVIGAALTFIDTRKAVLGMWAITGAILGFVLMGALSIGFVYISAFILMGASSMLGPKQRPRDYLLGLLFAVLGDAAQVGIMLATIRVL